MLIGRINSIKYIRKNVVDLVEFFSHVLIVRPVRMADVVDTYF